MQAQLAESLNAGSIAPIFKRVAQWIGLPERFVDRVSGHSTRVGATQDLSALDIDLAAITQAGAGSRRGCRCSMPRRSMRRGRGWRGPQKKREGIVQKANVELYFAGRRQQFWQFNRRADFSGFNALYSQPNTMEKFASHYSSRMEEG